MMLNQARPGDRVIIASLDSFGNQGFQRNLLDLGLTPGTIVDIVASHPFRGPITIRANETLIALGRGLASKLPVQRYRGRAVHKRSKKHIRPGD
jgi:Fe2+ transport system protein FeoA